MPASNANPSYVGGPNMSSQPDQLVVIIPKHLAQAIEWVLAPGNGTAPDLSRLTSHQLQLLPLPVAQAFMELSLAALQGPPRSPPSHSLWADAKTTQRARRLRQAASSLTAARQCLQAWYLLTVNAQQRRPAK